MLDAYGTIVIAFLASSLASGIIVTKLAQRRHVDKSYLVAGKGLPLFFAGTMLSIQAIDGNSSLGNVSLVYQFGFWSGAIIPFGLAISLVLTGSFYGKKLNKMTLLTLPDFYYRRYGFGAEGISSFLMMVSFIVLIAGNFASTGFILSSVLHIEFFWAMVFGAIIVLIYAFAGGLFSSAYSDVFTIYLGIIGFWARICILSCIRGIYRRWRFWSGIRQDYEQPPQFHHLTWIYPVSLVCLMEL